MINSVYKQRSREHKNHRRFVAGLIRESTVKSSILNFEVPHPGFDVTMRLDGRNYNARVTQASRRECHIAHPGQAVSTGDRLLLCLNPHLTFPATVTASGEGRSRLALSSPLFGAFLQASMGRR